MRTVRKRIIRATCGDIAVENSGHSDWTLIITNSLRKVWSIRLFWLGIIWVGRNIWVGGIRNKSVSRLDGHGSAGIGGHTILREQSRRRCGNEDRKKRNDQPPCYKATMRLRGSPQI